MRLITLIIRDLPALNDKSVDGANDTNFVIYDVVGGRIPGLSDSASTQKQGDHP
jgi:hypothetical protein